MLDEVKNLKDSASNSNIALKDSPISMSYTKTNKLISALYMVTDIMERDEPLRNKLRTLGADLVSDTYLLSTPNPAKVRQLNLGTRDNIEIKIAEILSFLEISLSINLISEMNYSILRKEFLELDKSIAEFIQQSSLNQPATLSEFFLEDSKGQIQYMSDAESYKGHRLVNKGHGATRIGVQKGSTLMQALNEVKMSDRTHSGNDRNSFDNLKKERRDEIMAIVKNSLSHGETGPVGVTITDIRLKAKGSLATCGEKTLQRELVSMVRDSLLSKTGSKRWSRYSLAK